MKYEKWGNYPGHRILKRKDASFPTTVITLDDCERMHRKRVGEIGCIGCKNLVQCVAMFDHQVDNRNSGTWAENKRESWRRDAKGTGEPDKTGSWIPYLSLAKSIFEEIVL